MIALPYKPEAYKLLHDGVRALAQVEANGIHIDLEYIDRSTRRIKRKVKHLKAELEKSDVMKVWKRCYGTKLKLKSTEQLGRVLFKEMSFPAPDTTEGGRYKVDEATLMKVDHPFVQTYLRMKKLEKAASTYLKGFARETIDGFMHPFFSLHLARTYRSSSEAPNFQNIPIRDPMIAKLIRSCIIPRRGWGLTEIDFSGAEVRVAACYHKDPAMIDYLLDDSKDMHRDVAAEVFFLKNEQIGKWIRHTAKNQFVFPQFYGDWYIDCARSMWDSIKTMKLATEDGIALYEHLKRKGIRELGNLDPEAGTRPGTFEHHVKQVERRFWDVRFPVYKQWKEDWFEDYRKQGWFQTLTGFICQGYMRKNEVINYGVQGSAFHCLLWALNQLVLRELPRRKMQTLIVGQIHDSLVADGPIEERADFLGLVQEIMTKRLSEAWDWLIIPMKVEADAAPVDAPWVAKKKVEMN